MDHLDELLPVRDSAPDQPGGRRITRRTALTAVLAGGLGVAGVGAASAYGLLHAPSAKPLDRGAIARVEAARRRSGATTAVSLTARRAEVDLGGRVVTAMTYGGDLPGRLVRATAGDLLQVDVRNELDQPTSVHWHGLAIRNDMDGVPGVTTAQVEAGRSARYEFVVPDPGTYWFHPHSGLQLDWGLYAPLIIDSPTEPGGYDLELAVLLDDWSPGLGDTPEQLLAGLQAGGGTMAMGGMSGMGGMSDTGDVSYPAYLANGRMATDATSLDAKPGQRVRLRIINAAADTTFDVAVAGHRMTVTHTDGFPVREVAVDTLRLAMGERYDAIITLGDGAFPVVAVPVGKAGTPARILLRTGSGTTPGIDVRPAELTGRRLELSDLTADISVRLPEGDPDTEQDVVLAGDMRSYRWTINGRSYDDTVPLTVRQGQTTRLRIVNRSMMIHPVHLHGHTFALRTTGRPRKDTVLVPSMGRIDVDLVADNPGRWMLHCHNAFHMEAGMMTRLEYTT